jgi:transposase-like protein
MSEAVLANPIFHDEEKAVEYLEGVRWPSGPICPHCGNQDKVYRIKGKTARPGLLKCGLCRKQFTVKVGTLFESSHIPLHKWLQATHLLCSSKKGISSHQLHRMMGITYKSAWFMTHRIREAFKDSEFANKLGGAGKFVEVDETYWGNKGKQRLGSRGYAHKEKIFSLVERDGEVRSFHVPQVTGKTLKPIMREQIERDTHIVTDEMGAYKDLDKEFDNHSTVCHSQNEYVRGPIYTNTIENYFSILKRGLTGVYQHVGPQHLKRYIGEFDFRYNFRKITDEERRMVALQGIEGKRLLYRDSFSLRIQ